jgi:hypothetical protein
MWKKLGEMWVQNPIGTFMIWLDEDKNEIEIAKSSLYSFSIKIGLYMIKKRAISCKETLVLSGN